MSRRAKVLLFGIPFLLLLGGLAWVAIRILFQREPGPDDVQGWIRYEDLKVRTSPIKEGTITTLMIGGVDFGGQFPGPDNPKDRGSREKDLRRLPTTYYHRYSPIAVVLERWNWAESVPLDGFGGWENRYWHWKPNEWHADARLPASMLGLTLADALAGGPLPGALPQAWTEPPIAVVGIMGAGILAAYARPYQFIDFYELSPAVIQKSIEPDGAVPTFTFVKDATERGANIRVFQGHPRKTFAEKAPDGFYAVLVIEPSRINDSPTRDLMTVEAMALFFQKGTQDAVLCYHTSNRHYNLAEAISVVAQDLKAESRTGNYNVHRKTRASDYASQWIMVAHKPGHLKAVLREPRMWEEGRFKSYNDVGRDADPAMARMMTPYWSGGIGMGRVMRDADSSGLADFFRHSPR